MWRTIGIFSASLILSLILQFSLSGQNTINLDSATISFSLKDILFAGLLFSNILLLVLLLRKL